MAPVWDRHASKNSTPNSTYSFLLLKSLENYNIFLLSLCLYSFLETLVLLIILS